MTFIHSVLDLVLQIKKYLCKFKISTRSSTSITKPVRVFCSLGFYLLRATYYSKEQLSLQLRDISIDKPKVTPNSKIDVKQVNVILVDKQPQKSHKTPQHSTPIKNVSTSQTLQLPIQSSQVMTNIEATKTILIFSSFRNWHLQLPACHQLNMTSQPTI